MGYSFYEFVNFSFGLLIIKLSEFVAKIVDGRSALFTGLRILVATVVGMVADGMGNNEILKAYRDLQQEDITEALRYAAEAVKERELPLVNVA